MKASRFPGVNQRAVGRSHSVVTFVVKKAAVEPAEKGLVSAAQPARAEHESESSPVWAPGGWLILASVPLLLLFRSRRSLVIKKSACKT